MWTKYDHTHNVKECRMMGQTSVLLYIHAITRVYLIQHFPKLLNINHLLIFRANSFRGLCKAKTTLILSTVSNHLNQD